MQKKKQNQTEKSVVVIEKASIFQKGSVLIPHDEDANKAMPLLTDCLLPKWKDGKLTRQPGTLSIRANGGMWAVTLRCPTEGLEVSYSSNRLLLILTDLEAYLATGSANFIMTFDAKEKAGQALSKLLES